MVRLTDPRAWVFTASVGAGAYAWQRREAIQRVDPELRHPILWAPLTLWNQAMLAPFSALAGKGGDPQAGADVNLKRHVVNGHCSVLVYLPRHRPRHAETGALLWFHGGGHVIGDPGIDNELCCQIARELQIPVISVDYRLAPKNPFPADLDDGIAALQWVLERTVGYGIDRDLIAVGGASAGGGLAAAVAQRAHDEGISLAAQLLVCPMLDDRTALQSDHGDRGQLVWNPVSNRTAWRAYLGDRFGQTPPEYAAPARREDLTGLAPAWIGVGELDLFWPEDEQYARGLRAAGVGCEFVSVPGMYHGADMFCPRTPSIQRFRDSMLTALRQAVVPAS